MKSLICVIILVLAVADAQWFQNSGRFIKEAAQGSMDMWRAYQNMRESNYKGADKYFHARGNYDAAQRGPGGRWASEVISVPLTPLVIVSPNVLSLLPVVHYCPFNKGYQEISNGREYWQGSVSGRGAEDTRADQEANNWGRNGGDPNRYRPKGLPDQY